jgi:hypothetical protein
MKATDEMVERQWVRGAAFRAWDERPDLNSYARLRYALDAALAVLPPPTPTLPAEPEIEPIRIAVWLADQWAEILRDNEQPDIDVDGPTGGRLPDAIVLARVKPLSPPVVAAVVERGGE